MQIDNKERAIQKKIRSGSINEKNYPNYYQILGVDLDASDKKIREVFVKLSLERLEKEKKGEISIDESTSLALEMMEAYGVLSDPDERGRYD
ncbi:25128_t:CDS:2 [Cetraspora pellucida]|uniref:25128_t:CDS:1 n=1 Tax=Cetraspora pellucida TaxID=1433469 RepID=A0A9N9FCD8_9GLOM|nr:25128_t:CDS:2 [Cetraspora pellucida]